MQGEPSVFEREAAAMKGKAGQLRSKIQVAGKDYEHQDFCQVSTAPHSTAQHSTAQHVRSLAAAGSALTRGCSCSPLLPLAPFPPTCLSACRCAGTAATWCAATAALPHTTPIAWG